MLSVVMLNVAFLYCYAEGYYAECCYAECCYAECCYAECHYDGCLYTECPYDKCCYTVCCGANIVTLMLLKFNSRFEKNKLCFKILKHFCTCHSQELTKQFCTKFFRHIRFLWCIIKYSFFLGTLWCIYM